jgi:hypothetical protein
MTRAYTTGIKRRGDRIMGYYAYKLDDATREGLLADIHPTYSQVEADHIVYKNGAPGESMPELDKAEIIGAVDDGKGLQIALVRINGQLERPDGKFYHIIWSRDPGSTHEIDHRIIEDNLKKQGVLS